jgi:uncharacterized protein
MGVGRKACIKGKLYQHKLDLLGYCIYIKIMIIEFDPAKNERNIQDRGLDFAWVADFDFETAVIIEDTRNNYGETRLIATGYLQQRLMVLVFKPTETGLRVISLRKANEREISRYEKNA